MNNEYLKDSIDESVSPNSDFYQFANGNWLKNNTIPPHESRWGSFLALRDQNWHKLHDILSTLARSEQITGSEREKLQHLFQSGMKEDALESEGLVTVANWLAQIKKFGDISNGEYFANLFESGWYFPWHMYVEPDERDSKIYSFRLSQGGLGLPDRDYYFKDDDHIKKIREAYFEYLKTIAQEFSNLGDPSKFAKTIFDFEVKLARASLDQTQRRDIAAQYNKFTFEELNEKFPELSFKEFFDKLSINHSNIIVDHPKFFAQVCEMLRSEPKSTWVLYLSFHLITNCLGKMGPRLEMLNFEFYGKVLSGLVTISPRWRRVTQAIDSSMGDALGKIFVEKYFPKPAQDRMHQLVADVREAFAERINNLSWMSPKTKEYALKKLGTYQVKVGFPDKWRDYSKVKTTPNNYLENLIQFEVNEVRFQLDKLSKPVDKEEWFMTPPTVNAYHYPNYSEIVFPAGILQSPFFDLNSDDAVNYGAIGSIIGHELTHGFDDNGRQFDHEGNFKDWWTPEDARQFEARTEKLVEQASKYEVQPGIFLNGKLTLGENIADLGGVEIAFAAFKKVLARKPQGPHEGFTPEQRFFLSFARSERELIRPEKQREYVITDHHSPAKFRVNQILKNSPEFYRAFKIREADGMYLDEANRAVIW